MEATFVRDIPNVRASQKLWKLSEPYTVPCWAYDDDETDATVVSHVITSATTVLGVPETYVFPAAEDGEIVDWGELPGSFKGALDHTEALAGFLGREGLNE